MPTLESVLQFRKAMYEESVALIEKKGHDYSGPHDDTLFNLKVCELLGIVPSAEVGILVRLSDKFMRLVSLMGANKPTPHTNESLRDTVRDIHNYVDYALQVHEGRSSPSSSLSSPSSLLNMFPGRW